MTQADCHILESTKGTKKARPGHRAAIDVTSLTEAWSAAHTARGIALVGSGARPPPARFDTAPVITVSLGVCSKGTHAAGTAAALLRGADAQLYLAKANGRHRACVAELDVPSTRQCDESVER